MTPETKQRLFSDQIEAHRQLIERDLDQDSLINILGELDAHACQAIISNYRRWQTVSENDPESTEAAVRIGRVIIDQITKEIAVQAFQQADLSMDEVLDEHRRQAGDMAFDAWRQK